MDDNKINFTILNKCVSLCAMRGSGKSEMLRYLVMAEQEKFNKIFVISPTNKINNFYDDFVKPENIFDEYNDEWIDKLMIEMAKVNKGKTTQKDKPKNILLILDDCCSNTRFHSSKSFEKIFTTGRHYFISLIITTQFLHHIPPSARSNSDFILVSTLNNNNVQILCDEYTLGSIDKKEFIEMYRRLSKDYGFLLINNSSVKDNNDYNSIYGSIRVPNNFIKNKN